MKRYNLILILISLIFSFICSSKAFSAQIHFSNIQIDEQTEEITLLAYLILEDKEDIAAINFDFQFDPEYIIFKSMQENLKAELAEKTLYYNQTDQGTHKGSSFGLNDKKITEGDIFYLQIIQRAPYKNEQIRLLFPKIVATSPNALSVPIETSLNPFYANEISIQQNTKTNTLNTPAPSINLIDKYQATPLYQTSTSSQKDTPLAPKISTQTSLQKVVSDTQLSTNNNDSSSNNTENFYSKYFYSSPTIKPVNKTTTPETKLETTSTKSILQKYFFDNISFVQQLKFLFQKFFR